MAVHHLLMLQVLLIYYQTSSGTFSLVPHLQINPNWSTKLVPRKSDHSCVFAPFQGWRDKGLVPCQPHSVWLLNLLEPLSHAGTARCGNMKNGKSEPSGSVQILQGQEWGQVSGSEVYLQPLAAKLVLCQHLSRPMSTPCPQPIAYRKHQLFWSKNCIISFWPYEEDT